MNLIWFRLTSKYIWKRNHFWIHIHLIFSFGLKKCIPYEKAIWIHQKICFFERIRKYIQNQKKGHLNLNFSDGFRKCIPYQKAIWIWIFQMDSELVCLTKRLSESIWIWIFQMDSENVFLAERPSESIWIWIFQMDSENVFLAKRSLESIWHWNFFVDTGKRFSLLKPGKKCWRVRQIMFSIEWSLESHIVSNVQIDSEKKHDKFDPSAIYSFEYLNLIVKDQFQNLCPHNVSLWSHVKASKYPNQNPWDVHRRIKKNNWK